MKKIKAGQLCTINETVFRAKNATDGCQGCDLNNIFLCPNVVDRRFSEPTYSCSIDGIIFKKI